MEKNPLEVEGKHCDDYIQDYHFPDCLRWFLFINRLPATEKMLAYSVGVKPTLFAFYGRKRVRVVMASRLGDVGITEDLKAEHGYRKRVLVKNLWGFSVGPLPI